MHPRAAAQRLEVLIGILGFFAAAALIVTVVAELRGQPALRPAMVLLGFVLALVRRLRRPHVPVYGRALPRRRRPRRGHRLRRGGGHAASGGLVHDLGRGTVPNGIWDKPGPLTDGEWERVRLHAYYTGRILCRVQFLQPLARLAAKDLEVYAGDAPAPGYSIDLEVEALARFADGLGLDKFHLLGYSGGGFVSLAFAGTHPDRLLSLALFEPASVPGDLSPDEERFSARLRSGLAGLDGPSFMRAFTRLQLRDDVQPPPPADPPPPWMRNRPAGLAAMMAAFERYQFDRNRLRDCHFPVFRGYGDLTGEHEQVRAAALARLLPDLHIRRFTGLHHFVPPEQIYSPDHVDQLRRLWAPAAVPVMLD